MKYSADQFRQVAELYASRRQTSTMTPEQFALVENLADMLHQAARQQDEINWWKTSFSRLCSELGVQAEKLRVLSVTPEAEV